MNMMEEQDKYDRLCVFVDLDGTIIDTLPDITTAINRTLLELGYGSIDADLVRSWIGDGSRKTVYEALRWICGASPSAPVVNEALALYTQNYRICCTEQSALFVGAREALHCWHSSGLTLACITNKASLFTHLLLDRFDLQDYFSIVVSGDTLAVRKPDPLPLLYACRKLQAHPRHVLMVGDSRNDVVAARAAAITVVCVTHGYNEGRLIESESPDLIIDALAELTPSTVADLLGACRYNPIVTPQLS